MFSILDSWTDLISKSKARAAKLEAERDNDRVTKSDVQKTVDDAVKNSGHVTEKTLDESVEKTVSANYYKKAEVDAGLSNVEKNREAADANILNSAKIAFDQTNQLIKNVETNLKGAIDAVRKTADSAKQIADTAYKNDEYTRQLADGATAAAASLEKSKADASETEREISMLMTRISLLEKSNSSMKYAASAEDVKSVSAADAPSTDLVVTSDAALAAMTESKTYKNVAVVGANCSSDITVRASESVVVDGTEFTGDAQKDAQGNTVHGRVNFAAKDVKISHVTAPEGSAYNLFEGNQDLGADAPHAESVVVNGAEILNPALAHNVLNVYTPAPNAKIVIKNSKFDISSKNTNPLRMANYLNSENVEITFENVDWTYENEVAKDEQWCGLMLYQPAGQDKALSGDYSAINTWKVTFDNCRYNGEKITSNDFNSRKRAVYAYDMNHSKAIEDPVEKGYFSVEFK